MPSAGRSRGPVGAAPRSPSPGPASVGGRRPSLLEASEGSRSGAVPGRGWRGWPRAGPSGAVSPAGLRGDPRARRTPAPRPRAPSTWRALAAVPASPGRRRLRALPPAPVPLPPSRPAVAPGHAGGSCSAARRARPGPAAPAPRATPPGLGAAPLAFPTSSRSLFSHLPVPRPPRLIQRLVINLAFQNGHRAG